LPVARRNAIAFEDFDPNDINQEWTLWAVYANGRFATYTSRGPALNGFMCRGQAKLYEYVPGQGWVERVVKDGDRPCDMCGDPDVRADWNEPYVWKREGSKIASPPELLSLCPACRKATGL
jgi:hypothetical protein